MGYLFYSSYYSIKLAYLLISICFLNFFANSSLLYSRANLSYLTFSLVISDTSSGLIPYLVYIFLLWFLTKVLRYFKSLFSPSSYRALAGSTFLIDNNIFLIILLVHMYSYTFAGIGLPLNCSRCIKTHIRPTGHSKASPGLW